MSCCFYSLVTVLLLGLPSTAPPASSSDREVALAQARRSKMKQEEAALVETAAKEAARLRHGLS